LPAKARCLARLIDFSEQTLKSPRSWRLNSEARDKQTIAGEIVPIYPIFPAKRQPENQVLGVLACGSLYRPTRVYKGTLPHLPRITRQGVV
jgi:hypothetical protein